MEINPVQVFRISLPASFPVCSLVVSCSPDRIDVVDVLAALCTACQFILKLIQLSPVQKFRISLPAPSHVCSLVVCCFLDRLVGVVDVSVAVFAACQWILKLMEVNPIQVFRISFLAPSRVCSLVLSCSPERVDGVDVYVALGSVCQWILKLMEINPVPM